MDKLREIVIRTLNINGFGYVVAIEEQKNQIKIVEYTLVSLWLFLSCVFIKSLTGILLQLFLFFIALIGEQVLLLVFFYFVHRKKFNYKKMRLQSLSRSVYQRLTVVFFCLYFLLIFSYLIPYLILHTPTLISVWYGLVLGAFPPFFVMDNLSKKKDRTIWGMVFYFWYSISRGGRQILSILGSGLGFVIPGVALAFIVGAISQDFWQFIDVISWINLLIVLGLVVLFILMPSSSLVAQTLDIFVRDLKQEDSFFSVEKLYKAVIRCSSDADLKKILRQQFDVYSDCYSWKWKQSIYDRALTNLSDELKMRAKWHFWLGVLLLFPVTFFVLFVVGNILFSKELLGQWISGIELASLVNFIVESFLSGRPLQLSQIWQVILRDPIAKFSAVSTFLLIAYFAVDYSKDGAKIFSNLRLKKGLMDEWITLLCAYHVLHEEGFQYAFPFLYTTHGGYKPVYLHVLLLPNNADSVLAYRVVGRAKEFYDTTIDYCFVMVTMDEFSRSNMAITNYVEIENNLTNGNPSISFSKSKCWVGLNKNGSKMNINEVLGFDDAFTWALNYFRVN